jgi:hypothetical protein
MKTITLKANLAHLTGYTIQSSEFFNAKLEIKMLLLSKWITDLIDIYEQLEVQELEEKSRKKAQEKLSKK